MGYRDDFDKDLEVYLSQRKGRRIKAEDVIDWLRNIIPKRTVAPPVEMPPEIEPYHEAEKPKTIKEELAVIEAPDKDFEKKKKSILQMILDKINSFKQGKKPKEDFASTLEEEKIKDLVEKEMLLQDMKDLAKITLFVIKQLPEEDLKRFKNSSDFEDLKILLQKHGLIK